MSKKQDLHRQKQIESFFKNNHKIFEDWLARATELAEQSNPTIQDFLMLKKGIYNTLFNWASNIAHPGYWPMSVNYKKYQITLVLEKVYNKIINSQNIN